MSHHTTPPHWALVLDELKKKHDDAGTNSGELAQCVWRLLASLTATGHDTIDHVGRRDIVKLLVQLGSDPDTTLELLSAALSTLTWLVEDPDISKIVATTCPRYLIIP